MLGESGARFILKQTIAALLGAAIGLQREFGYVFGKIITRSRFAAQPVRRAGLRTHMLVALGACLFSEASWSAFAVPVPSQTTVRGAEVSYVSGAFNYDTSRVAAQIVSGVGFLGAGTIWKSSGGAREDQVFGLTTAASLWTTAAVGMHVGGANQKDPYFLTPAFATALIVVTLQALVHLETRLHKASQSWTTRHQSATVEIRIDAGIRTVAEAARDAVAAAERAVGGRVVGVGVDARVETDAETRAAPIPRPESSDTIYDQSQNATSEIRARGGAWRRVRVTLTAVLPPLATGLDLLDALAATDGCVAASIEETRGNHVSLESPRDDRDASSKRRVAVGGRSKSVTFRSDASLPVSTRGFREPRRGEGEFEREEFERERDGDGDGAGAGELDTPLLLSEAEARVGV